MIQKIFKLIRLRLISKQKVYTRVTEGGFDYICPTGAYFVFPFGLHCNPGVRNCVCGGGAGGGHLVQAYPISCCALTSLFYCGVEMGHKSWPCENYLPCHSFDMCLTCHTMSGDTDSMPEYPCSSCLTGYSSGNCREGDTNSMK